MIKVFFTMNTMENLGMSPGALPSRHLVFQLVVFPLILGVELKAHSLAQDGVLLSR